MAGMGGARPGAGRPKGIHTKKKYSRLAILARLQSVQLNNPGELPHEFLLRVSRGERIQHGTKTILVGKGKNATKKQVPDYITPSFELRIEAAHKAAPYFAPRLSAIEVSKGMTDEQLDSLIASLAPQAGVIIDVGGKSTQTERISRQEPAAAVRVDRPKLLARSAPGQPVPPPDAASTV